MAARKRTSSERRRISKADWLTRALRLDERGWSLRRIARHLGLDHKTVSEALKREYDARAPTPEMVDAARARAVARREADLEFTDQSRIIALRIRKAFLAKGIRGNAAAARLVLDAEKAAHDALKVRDKALTALSRLEGTDAPKRSELTGPGGGPLEVGLGALSDETLDAAIEKLSAGRPDEGRPPGGTESGEGT